MDRFRVRTNALLLVLLFVTSARAALYAASEWETLEGDPGHPSRF